MNNVASKQQPKNGKERQFYNMLQLHIATPLGSRHLRMAATQLASQAAKGKPWAIVQLRDTLDGKPAQRLVHSGDEDSPIRFALVPNPSENGQKWLEDIGRSVVDLEAKDLTGSTREQGKGLDPDASNPSQPDLHLPSEITHEYQSTAEILTSEAADACVAPSEPSGSCSLAQDEDDTC